MKHKCKPCDEDLGVKWKYDKKRNQCDGLSDMCVCDIFSHAWTCRLICSIDLEILVVCQFAHYILRLIC